MFSVALMHVNGFTQPLRPYSGHQPASPTGHENTGNLSPGIT